MFRCFLLIFVHLLIIGAVSSGGSPALGPIILRNRPSSILYKHDSRNCLPLSCTERNEFIGFIYGEDGFCSGLDLVFEWLIVKVGISPYKQKWGL